MLRERAILWKNCAKAASVLPNQHLLVRFQRHFEVQAFQKRNQSMPCGRLPPWSARAGLRSRPEAGHLRQGPTVGPRLPALYTHVFPRASHVGCPAGTAGRRLHTVRRSDRSTRSQAGPGLSPRHTDTVIASTQN